MGTFRVLRPARGVDFMGTFRVLRPARGVDFMGALSGITHTLMRNHTHFNAESYTLFRLYNFIIYIYKTIRLSLYLSIRARARD